MCQLASTNYELPKVNSYYFQRGVVIGQRVALSPTDIKEIQILYDCIPRPSGSGNGGSGSFVTSAPVTIKPVSGGNWNFNSSKTMARNSPFSC